MFFLDYRDFFSLYRKEFEIKKLSQNQVDRIQTLLVTSSILLDRIRHVAYVMATAQHETGMWNLLVEGGSNEYFDKYEPHTKLGEQLGNTEPGDGYKYRGRGYVQITGKNNYARMYNLLSNSGNGNTPNFSAEPSILELHQTDILELNARICILGMRDGLFTGQKMSDFIADDLRTQNYYKARKVVNPGELKVKPEIVQKIADHAVLFEKILRRCIL